MSILSWLAPAVQEQRLLPVARPLRGLTAPVWTMAVGLMLRSVMLLAAVVAPVPGAPVGTDRAVLGALSFTLGVVILGFRWQPPHWFLHLNVTAWLAVSGWLIATAPSALAVPMNLLNLIAAGMYVGAWFPPHQMYVHLASAVVFTFVGVLAYGDLPGLFLIWFVTILFAVFTSGIINLLMRQVLQFASRDVLTGLLNRAGLMAFVEQPNAIAGMAHPVSVAVLDLDDFKAVNDTLGHQAGDDLLASVGAVLRTNLRASDIVARTGGDEFLLLLGGSDVEAARVLLERIRMLLPAPASIGIAAWPSDTHFDEVVATADRAMYADKAARGRQP